MDQIAFQEFLGAAAATADFDALESFLDRLYVHNEVKNLTRISREDALERHIADSLLFQDLIPQKARVADLGTGPGFPAWPLAWLRPDIQVFAIDSNGKMLDFLKTVPLPNLVIVHARVEDSRELRNRFDFVTGRAFAPLAVQLEVSAALAKPDAIVAPMRTEGETFELRAIREIGLKLDSVSVRKLGDATRAMPLYRRVGALNPGYPRPWAVIKKTPLL